MKKRSTGKQTAWALDETERSECRDRSTSQGDAHNHTRQDIAQKVHAQYDARHRNAQCEKKKHSFERGVKVADHERDGKRSHRVARRKRKLIRRQHLRPAVRLDLARPGPLAQSLQCFEYKNAQNRGTPRCADGRKTLRASIREQHQPQAVPDPPVAHARGGDHPDANPARRAPVIHPPHQPVIAPVDISPEVACDCHRLTSPRRPETDKRSQRERCTNKRERFLPCKSRAHALPFASFEGTDWLSCSRAPQLAQLASKFESKSHSMRLRFSPRSMVEDHFRQKRISFIQCPAVNAGTSTASGDSASVQGLSQKSDRTMLNTSAVSLPQLPCAPWIRPRPVRSPAKNSSTVRAPGTSVKVCPTPAMVCESLPAIAIFPSRAASREALSLAPAHICPLRVSNVGTYDSNQWKSCFSRRPVNPEKT